MKVLKLYEESAKSMKYKELVAEADEQVVKHFLLEYNASLDFQSICGFIYGLAMTPEDIECDEWLNYALGNENSGENFDKVGESLTRIFDNHVQAFRANNLRFPFNLSHMIDNNSSMEPLISWIRGLLDALYFRSSFWDGEAFPAFDGDRQQLLYHSMLMIEGIVEPAMVKEVFEKLPLKVLHQVYPTLDLYSDAVERQIIMICIMSSQDAVEALQQFARDIQEKEKEQSEEVAKKAGEIIKVNFTDRTRKE